MKPLLMFFLIYTLHNNLFSQDLFIETASLPLETTVSILNNNLSSM